MNVCVCVHACMYECMNVLVCVYLRVCVCVHARAHWQRQVESEGIRVQMCCAGDAMEA